MKNVRLISLGIGLLIGGILGGVAVWSMTKNFVDRAVTAAEERFEGLLQDEKDKLQDKVDDATRLKERLEATLAETESKVDSLNTTIENRNKELIKIKRNYDKKVSSIDNMSHNELSDFFAKRYGE
jgi:chromosome segregation ATPase